MEEVPTVIDIHLTNPIQALNLHESFWILCVSFKLYFFKKKKRIDVVTEAQQQRQEVY